MKRSGATKREWLREEVWRIWRSVASPAVKDYLLNLTPPKKPGLHICKMVLESYGYDASSICKQNYAEKLRMHFYKHGDRVRVILNGPHSNERLDRSENGEREAKEERWKELEALNADSATSSKSSKRSLSESEAATSAKRIKLQTAEDSATPLEKPAEQGNKEKEELAPERAATPLPPPVKIIALNAIDEYMKIKTLKKLTYRDLEQIVLQKMCEAICHKSEIGELRHQLDVQEQMVEMWRIEVAQLTKQARELEIVNKRLLHEVRLKNERDKPLIPVKITRSVGLQVVTVVAPKRRMARPQVPNPQSTIALAKKNIFNAANRANTINRVSVATKIITPKKVVKTNGIVAPNKIVTSSLKKVLSPKSQNTLLSKALQNSAAAATATIAPALTPIAPPTPMAITAPTSTPSTTANKSVAEFKTVIGLTDEDDKISAPVKTLVTTAGVVNPPRKRYAYNNQLLHQGLLPP